MKKTHLRNKFLKDGNKENKRRYLKQRNYCVLLITVTSIYKKSN